MGNKQTSYAGASAGYRFIHVYPCSPAKAAGVEVFFDYVIKINGEEVSPNQNLFVQQLNGFADQDAIFTIINLRTRETREISISLTKSWGGTGLLGAHVKHEEFSKFDEDVNNMIRILNVHDNSPGLAAGLVSLNDYIIGKSDKFFESVEEFAEFVEQHVGHPLHLWVFNSLDETTRVVEVLPSADWGGRGLLGCELSTGFLHRIPEPKNPAGVRPPVSRSSSMDAIRDELENSQDKEPLEAATDGLASENPPSGEQSQSQSHPPAEIEASSPADEPPAEEAEAPQEAEVNGEPEVPLADDVAQAPEEPEAAEDQAAEPEPVNEEEATAKSECQGSMPAESLQNPTL